MNATTTALSETLPALVDSFDTVLERVYPGLLVMHDGRRGVGAGILWGREGLVLTNNHVVGRRTRHLNVHLADGTESTAQLVARRPEADLALLTLKPGSYPGAWIGDSLSLRVGDLVLAIGHPWGQPNYVTLGIVSALTQAVDRQGKVTIPVIRSDAALAPGNSGGPLVNAMGAVVGINTMIVGGDQGVAVPIHVAQQFVDETLASGAESSRTRRNGKGHWV